MRYTVESLRQGGKEILCVFSKEEDSKSIA